MCIKWVVFFLICLIFLNEVSTVSASPPARIVAGIVTNVVSTLFKWLWSYTAPSVQTEKVASTRSLMKFEGGYTVETVFDGSKAGIEPYSVVSTPSGELLMLDSSNSNLYKISAPLSRYSRPKIIAGSPEGYTGHIDGKLREARLYHPKGITVDDSGNIYVADTMNMAIRKISNSGITTIAGSKWSHGGHSDGAGEDAKLSDDFDVIYVRSSCSLLVTDRGNQAIREIRLHDADCSYEHPAYVQHEEQEESLHLGIAVLVAALFCGYMLALLKQRVQSLFSKNNDPRPQFSNHAIAAPYPRPLKSVRPPIIPPEDEDASEDLEDEGLLFSFGRLIINASSSVAEVFAGLLFSGFRKKRTRHQNLRHFQQLDRHIDHGWPVQDTYLIRHEDEPPLLETRNPVMRKSYPLMDTPQQQSLRNNQIYSEEQDNKAHQQIPQQQQQQENQQQRSTPTNPKASSEKGSDKGEVVFGAVQEQDGRREAMVIKAVDYSDPMYSHQNIRPRLNYMGYSSYSYR